MLVIRKSFTDMMLGTDNEQELPGVQVGRVKGWFGYWKSTYKGLEV